jgi:hypothetical protein
LNKMSVRSHPEISFNILFNAKTQKEIPYLALNPERVGKSGDPTLCGFLE